MERGFKRRSNDMCCPPDESFAVSKLPKNQLGVELAGFDQLLLQIVVDRRLLRVQKAGPHADVLGTECRRCNEASVIAEPSTRDHRHIQLINSAWQQNQRSDAVLTGMPASMPTAAQPTFRDKALFFGLRICERRLCVNSIVYATCIHGYLWW
jgi:hypothetical protein